MSIFKRIGELDRVTTAINTDDSRSVAVTVPITGMPRGGTTMVAAVVEALGVYLGPKHDMDNFHFEDQVMHSPDRSVQTREVGRRNAIYKTWGWKDPVGALPIQDILPTLRNPRPIIVMRDVAAAVQSEQRFEAKYHPEGGRTENDILEQMSRWSNAICNFATTTKYPMLLVSYERAMNNPEMFIEEVAAFLGIELTQARRDKARARIAPQGGYLITEQQPALPIKFDDIRWWYINLSHRTDRLEHITQQLAKAGIEGTRFEALHKEDYTGPIENVAEMQGTPNTIGNWLSHTEMYRKAIVSESVIGVLEDDALLCSDFEARLRYVDGHFHKPWDIFFLGGTFHDDPIGKWHPELGKDFELTDVDHIVRVYGAFSNQGYLINPQNAEKVLGRMEEVMPQSRGSDHALIKLQPELECYCFVPGMVFQIDGPSDIGEGDTIFSNFLKMGGHVWSDTLADFNFFDWKERVK